MHRLSGACLLSLVTLAACGTTPQGEAKAPKKVGCERARAERGPQPLSRQSSMVALARDGKRTLAYIANADDDTLRTVDVDAGKELATTRLAGKPGEVLVLPDGRVLVTLRSRSRVQVFEPATNRDKPLDDRCQVDLPAEPIAMALTPNRSTVVVTSGWGHALTELDASSMKRKKSTSVPREPRSVVLSDDGKRAFVSHAVGGRLSVVPLAGGKVREVLVGDNPQGKHSVLFGFLGKRSSGDAARIGCQGYALAKSVDPGGRILAPQVLVEPGNPSEQTQGYGDGFSNAEVASIAVIDESAERTLTSSIDNRESPATVVPGARARPECLLPRAAAMNEKSGHLLVTCLGIDALVEYDASSADPRRAELRRWPVAAGPLGLAVDVDKQRAVVWGQFDGRVSIVALGAAPMRTPDDIAASSVTQLALSKSATLTKGDVALGRRLFHSTGDFRISRDGRACASCHPEGRDDSITWATPNGPRQTPMLAGRLGQTAPFGWDGKGADIEAHLGHTFQRLGGSGLERREMDAILAYLATLEPPPRLTDEDPALVKRGRDLFLAKETGCAGCHRGSDLYMDGKTHDVKSRVSADRDPHFDTPSLKFIAGTAPYFHDGRYASLEELLRGSDGKMGHTKQLSKRDLAALAAYLRTL